MARIQKRDQRKRLYLYLIILVFMTVQPACVTRRTVPKNQNTVYLEKELAETNQKIEEIYHRMSVIQFMVDNHEKAIQDMEKGASPANRPHTVSSMAPPSTHTPLPSAPGPEETESPETLYNEARNAYNNGDYGQSAALFAEFTKNFPDHTLADNALYWHGECLYAQKDFQGAIAQFKQLINTYPDSNKVPDALLKTGYAFLSIQDKDNAKRYLKKVTWSYPFSAAATKAEEMLKKIKG